MFYVSSLNSTTINQTTLSIFFETARNMMIKGQHDFPSLCTTCYFFIALLHE
uniref:Uncharacterized protein n=1 Tax=Parascaris equorum TaxID=6256 RepID=A0A914RXZ3_PAREQ